MLFNDLVDHLIDEMVEEGIVDLLGALCSARLLGGLWVMVL